jgi:beta-glucosidase
MTDRRFFSGLGALGALMCAAGMTGCGHPAINSGAGGGSVDGVGGANGNPDAGLSATGGHSNESGLGGAGPGTGTGGAGGAVQVTKVACGSATPTELGTALDYTRPYAATPAITAMTNTLFSGLTDDKSKADQMRGTVAANTNYDSFETPNTTTIKGFRFRDGPRGVNLDAKLTSGTGYSTAFPAAMARGASFDLDLEYQIGQAIGDETLASGNTMILAPTVNILRHPAWGRAQETYGEDPFLLGRLGTAFTVGVQEYIAACAKHYAANNIENGRETAHAQMDEQTLREIYARHFEMIIKDGGLACVMAAYNLVGITGPTPFPDTKSTENSHLLTDVLRTDFGFRGFVLSDWWAMSNAQNLALVGNAQGTTTLQDIARKGISAGLDMELPWSFNYSQLEALVQGGSIARAQFETSVKRVLEQKVRFNAYNLSGQIGLKATATHLDASNSITGNEVAGGHIELAGRAALRSSVLLKNENKALPINLASGKKLAILGATVTARYGTGDGTTALTDTTNFSSSDPKLGTRTGDRGSSRVNIDPAKTTSPAAGIRAAAMARGLTVIQSSNAADAASADFIVVIAGLTVQDEGEEYTGAGDRVGTVSTSTTPNLALDAKNSTGAVQNPLIMAAAALGKPMAVILEGGSVIDLPWLTALPATSAVVMAWYPGMDGGHALADLLFHANDNANFGAKLPITWPQNVSQEPQFSGGTNTVMDYYLGYRWFDNKALTPLFPFGFGLSYTTFSYGNARLSKHAVAAGATPVSCSDVNKDGIVDVIVDVRNTGMVAGEEVVMVFASYPSETARRPMRELKGFHRTSSIPAGGGLSVTIPVRISDLKFWDSANSRWAWSSQVKLLVGPSVANLTAVDTFTVN